MAKITNKQTRPTAARVLNATEVAIEANAVGFATRDEASTDAGVEFVAMFAGCDVEEFKARRACWVKAYDTARSVVGGAKRFAELVAAYDIVKPQSEEAKRKQAARAAAKANGATESSDAGEGTPMDGAGAAAAQKVKAELTAIEAHVLALFRSGKFEMLTSFIAEHADAQ